MCDADSKKSRKRKAEDQGECPVVKCLKGQAYCIKCRKVSAVLNAVRYLVEFIYHSSSSKRKDGRCRIRGTCERCGARISRMISRAEFSQEQQEEKSDCICLE